MANIQHEGVKVAFPLINSAGFSFEPDIPNNQIIFGLKGINGINTELAQTIIDNRPYKDINDFVEKLIDTKIITPSKMIKLIKGGCFTELHSPNRELTMQWYINNYLCQFASKLTLAQLGKMKEMQIIPDEYKKALQVLALKNYILDDEGLYELYNDPDKKPLKKGYHDRYYILDDNSQTVFLDYFTENSVVKIVHAHYVVSEKLLLKEVEAYLEPLRVWFTDPDTLNKYNLGIFLDAWEKYANGSMPKWSMEALCYYDNEHELEHVNEDMYGIVNFNELPEEPDVYEWTSRKINNEWKQVPKYKIVRIAGTVLHADNNHHTIYLLTKYGPCLCKLNKGHYAFYSKRISRINDKGEKEVLENSWLTRGNLLLISGIRRDDQFYPVIYTDTIYKHTINLIKKVNNDGTLELQVERTKL